jgi:hypothetical protein
MPGKNSLFMSPAMMHSRNPPSRGRFSGTEEAAASQGALLPGELQTLGEAFDTLVFMRSV